MFADWYHDHPFIHVPAVIAQLSSDRVLTSELADGVQFADMESSAQSKRTSLPSRSSASCSGVCIASMPLTAILIRATTCSAQEAEITFLDYGVSSQIRNGRHDPPPTDDPDDDPQPRVTAFRVILEQSGILRSGAPVFK